ncbi:glutathione S-transferase C-terminal domain-containing protein homolog [Anopheles maculipalpis]|uniref:glutathione S-transferase C-terminal domain-containing protein homolog n=1 Tax=Anopheles maculipalpis TaxID=1496333 RepID=UPI002158C8DA|nr:glutathione S-transferase C-terminal domain-containing protein homolog [Anopheles maculipalpis]
MKLYLKYYRAEDSAADDTFYHLEVPLETFIVLVLYRYLEINPSNVVVHFVQCKATSNVLPVVVPRSMIVGNFIAAPNMLQNDDPALYCQLPSISIERIDTIVSGLCGVCRRLTKEHVKESPKSEGLLGFKGNTLVAPADASLWTKFCEIDIIRCVEDLLSYEVDGSNFPNELGQFESHLQQPLKSHNIYKLINLVNNVRISSNEEHQKLVAAEERFDFHANHKFAEGYDKTLADLILFICFDLIVCRLTKDFVREKCPNTMEWLERVDKDDDGTLKRVCNELMMTVGNVRQPSPLTWSSLEKVQIIIPKEFSLYKSDTKKLNLKGDQILTTNQAEVLDILSKVSQIPTDIGSTENDWETNQFNWDTIPIDARPEGGKLPPARILRKRHQLESLVNEVMQLATDGSIIVDFCSGTGHLGILLAYLLPSCTIYLLENKEESQQRAMERVGRLALRNVVFFQCNLDYFTARFDIGVSLHACGVATDIVLEKCFAHRAHFVSCPCCYGKLYNIEHVTYPRSQLFQRSELLLKEYFCLAHCADQTHDLSSDRTNVAKAHQGFYCMDVIDRDRALRAEELGYVVLRKRLKDETCTPKNRLLVGVYGSV